MSGIDIYDETTSAQAVIAWEQLDKRKFYVFGPAFALVTRLVIYPTALVKTRLQVQGTPAVYFGPVDAFRKIIQREGALALYKGFLSHSIGVLGGQTYITTFELVREHSAKLTLAETPRNLLAGAVASLVGQSIMTPIDVVSQRLMVQGQHVGDSVATPSLTTRQLIRHISNSEGLRGFYQGYWASVLTAMPSSAIWWATYGVLRRHLLAWGDVEDRSRVQTLALQAIGGASAGFTAAWCTNPLDVARARLQVLNKHGDGATVGSVVRTLWRNEGLSGLFRGVSARMLHTAQSSVLIIMAYETVKRLSLKSEYREDYI